MVARSVAPVANTITSTTSATQDLEVFTNYPSEKNNKLIQEKYGSQDEFFKKIAEEGYKQGFESVPKPSFDPNLPATDISKETFQRFLDPKGTEVYKGTPLEQYAGTGDLTRNIPTMQSTFPEGQAIPIEEFEKWKTMDKSGVTDLGKSWNQAGGEFTMPSSYPSMSTEEDRIRQAKEAQLYGINNIGRSTPSTGAPTYTGEGSALPTVSESKKMTKLDDEIMYSDAELRNMGFSEEQIGRGVQPNEQPDNEKRRQEQSQLYGIDTRGIKSIETKDENVISGEKEKSQLGKEWDYIKKGGKWIFGPVDMATIPLWLAGDALYANYANKRDLKKALDKLKIPQYQKGLLLEGYRQQARDKGDVGLETYAIDQPNISGALEKIGYADPNELGQDAGMAIEDVRVMEAEEEAARYKKLYPRAQEEQFDKYQPMFAQGGIASLNVKK